MKSNNNSCQGARQNIYNMNTQELLNYFFEAAIQTLTVHGTDEMQYFSNVDYLPMRCLLVNAPPNPKEVQRVHTIGLLGNLLSSIIWINEKINNKELTQEQARVAFNRITHVCAVLLNFDRLDINDLFYIAETNQYKQVKGLLENSVFFKGFDETELKTVRACFSQLRIRVGPEMEEVSLGPEDASFYGDSSSGNSSSANPENRTFAESRRELLSRQSQQKTSGVFGTFGQSQLSPQTATATTTTTPTAGLFGTGQPLQLMWNQPQKSSFHPDFQSSFHPDFQSSFQSAAQLRTVPRPDLNNEKACLAYLGFEEIPTIDELNERVNLIRQNPEGRGHLDITLVSDALETFIIGNNDDADFELGGKRRTMKVKKHFRKTRKRFVKKVKKTRVRRNNKSKRAFKGKKG
jgi:hypothetical protein